jgi:hypothetical protein
LPLGLPHTSAGGNGKALLAALAFCGLIEVTYVAGLGAETSLSLVADVCTAPLVPWINHVELFPGPVPRPGLSGAPVPQPLTRPVAAQPPTVEEVQDGDVPPLGFSLKQYPPGSIPDFRPVAQEKAARAALPDVGLGLRSFPDETEQPGETIPAPPDSQRPWNAATESGEGASALGGFPGSPRPSP